ncbi:hypothetical protein GCM10027445_52470 [Amycolatopsis endophytica]
MPLRFWGDDDGQRLRDSYFSRFPGVWTHGDRLELTARGTGVITGRSDATINRGGVRTGTAEIYPALLAVSEVDDAVAVDLSRPGAPGRLILLVALAGGGHLDDELRRRIRTAIRTGCSPHHVPGRSGRARRDRHLREADSRGQCMLNSHDVVNVEAVRTPIGRGHAVKGIFRDLTPRDLPGAIHQAVLGRAGLDAGEVHEVITGCVQQIGEQGVNIARNAWLHAGLPVEVPAGTVDTRCGASQRAGNLAAALIASGARDIVVAAGVEHAGRVPSATGVRIQEEYGDAITPLMIEDFGLVRARNLVGRGPSAERIAPAWHVSRADLEAWAVRSHRLAAQAAEPGLRPRGRVRDHLLQDDDPLMMLTAPIPLTRRMLDRNGMKIGELDVVEINEAAVPMVKVWLAELRPDEDRVNPRGGAIALGHPPGASGARLITTLIHELEDSDAEPGFVTMCCAGGIATGTLLERVQRVSCERLLRL